MPMPELAVDTAAIVIKGSFEPSRLSPTELANQGLVTAGQLTDAVQKFSTDDISIFETKRIRFVANREIIELTAQQSDEFEPLRDLAVGILRLFISESVSVLGINRNVHFAAKDEEAWDAVGDALTPKGIWSAILDAPGMLSLTLQAARPGKFEGYRQITIQPSNSIRNGVFVSHNDHYTLDLLEKPGALTRDQLRVLAQRPAKPNPNKVLTAIEVLEGEWESSMNRADAVVQRVAQEAKS
jgi:hypothetical protein